MSSLPRITGSQPVSNRKADSNNQPGLRYGTLGKSSKPGSLLGGVKPSIGEKYGLQSSVNSSRYYKRLHTVKNVLEWYQSWQPWQQKILLDGIIERLTSTQWEILASMLEPVFHRDFRLSLYKRYPSAPLKRGVLDTKVLERKIWDTFYNALMNRHNVGHKPTQGNDADCVSNGNISDRVVNEGTIEQSIPTQENDADCVSNGNTSDRVMNEGTIEQSIPELRTSQPQSESEVQAAENIDKDGDEAVYLGEQASLQPSDVSNLNEGVESGIGVSKPAISWNENIEIGDLQHVKIQNNDTNEEDDNNNVEGENDEEEDDDFEECDSNVDIPQSSPEDYEQTDLSESTLALVAEDFVSKIISEALKQFKAIKRSERKAKAHHPKHKSPVPGKLPRNSESTPSSASSGIFHRVKSIINLDNVSKLDFFANVKKSRLGSMQRLDYGGRLPLIEDINMPLQRSFKPAKWWTLPENGRTLVTANKHTLNRHFKAQLGRIYQLIDDMESHECLNLLVEMVKISCTDLVNYLAQSLSRRLHEQGDINQLSDHILLYIFTLLDHTDLKAASQVCRRWRYLCDREDLWISKIDRLGKNEGVDNLLSVVQDSHDSSNIDWKKACVYVESLTERAKKHIQLEKGVSQPKVKAAKWYKFEMYTVAPPVAASEDEKEGETATSVKSGQTKGEEEELGASTTEDSEEISEYELQALSSRPLRKEMASYSSRNAANVKELDTARDKLTSFLPAKDLLGKNIPTTKLEFQVDYEHEKSKVTSFAGYLSPLSGVKKLEGHMDVVSCIEIDKRRLFSGSMDRTIRLWDVRSGRCVHKFYGHKGGIRCLKFDSKNLYSGSWDTTIMLWDLVSFKRRLILADHTRCVSCLAVNDKYFYCCVSIIKNHQGGVTCLEIDGGNIISGDTNCTILVHNIQSETCLRTFSGHVDGITTLLLCNDLIISGDAGGRVFFWNKNSDKGEGEAAIQAHDLDVNKIAFHNGRFFTASTDHTAKEWDLVTMTAMRLLTGHTGPVKDIKVMDRRMITCSDDGHIRIWETKKAL